MPDERDQEITSKKVTSNSNAPLNRYSVSEERTTKVKDDGSSNAVIIVVLLFLAVGAGAVAYFLNNRPAPTPILVPSAVDTVRENKSTIIERNNTTIKEVSPATSQSTPKVEITVQPQPVAPAPAPAVTVTAQPTATPAATPKAATPSATPTTGSPNN
jgi:cytoskeletal protein RodZ